MTPTFAQPYVFGPLPPGVGGGHLLFLILPKKIPGLGTGPTWTRDKAQPGPGTGLSLDQARGLFGALLGPIWEPILRDPFRGIGRGPGIHLEAEGRHFGGRRPTKWGSGGGAPRNQKKVKNLFLSG